MGKALTHLVAQSPSCALSGLIEREGHPELGQEIAGMALSCALEPILSKGCGVIDFSSAGAQHKIAPLVSAAQGVYVVGATALTPRDQEALAQAAKKIAVIASENMSFGVALLSALVERAAQALPMALWDIEIHEMHHRHKKDAPSGTAFLLGRAVARGREQSLDKHMRLDQQGEREQGAIGFSSMRGGNHIGTHHVSFLSEGESLTFTHQAHTREIFAMGALQACLWGRNKAAGLYTMRDVLGL